MYGWFPNSIISIFFPVNESIWEHMKILYTSILFGGLVEYILLKIYKIDTCNFNLQLIISSYLSIIIYLIIYLPIFLLFGENLIVSISLMILVYGIIEIISYYIMKYKCIKWNNSLGILIIIIGYFIFIYFTYNPPHNFIFYDNLNGYYGIKTENDY